MINLNPAVLTRPLIPVQSPAASVSSGGSDGFGAALANAIGDVEASQAGAQQAAENFLIAGKGDVHTVALASQQAELTMELFQQMKNKFVQAYQEIMKSPI